MDKILINAILKELKSRAIKRFVFLVILFLPVTVLSKEINKQSGEWVFYNYFEGEISHCIIYTQSLRARGLIHDNDNVSYLYLVKKGKKAFSIGASFDYELDRNKEIVFEINNSTYPFSTVFTNNAWSFSSIEDVILIDRMLRTNSFVKIRSFGRENESILNYYSLEGFKEALENLNECKL